MHSMHRPSRLCGAAAKRRQRTAGQPPAICPRMAAHARPQEHALVGEDQKRLASWPQVRTERVRSRHRVPLEARMVREAASEPPTRRRSSHFSQYHSRYEVLDVMFVFLP